MAYHPSRMASRSKALGPLLKVDCNSKSLEGAVTEPCLPQHHLPAATTEDPLCLGQSEPISTASSIAVAVKRSDSWLINHRSNPIVVTHVL